MKNLNTKTEGEQRHPDLDLCLKYILDNEREDFEEYPNILHVYFLAYSQFYGMKDAIKELKQCEKNLKGLSND